MTEASIRIRELAEPLAASLQVSLWGVDVQVGPKSVVRVYVEKEGGVSIDDCAELSRLLGLSLEVEDVIENAYVLEVSSPGLERRFFTLEQLYTALGKKVEFSLFSALPEYPKRRKYIGTIKSITDQNICVVVEDVSVTGKGSDEVVLPWGKVKKARQIYIEPEKKLPGKKGSKKNLPQSKQDSTIKEGAEIE